MPALTCPYCDAYANFTERVVIIKYDEWRVRRPGADLTDIVAWSCDSCANPIVGARMFNSRVGPPLWYEPKKVVSVEFPDVPDHIASDASEAFRCSGVNAWRATVAIARRAVQAATIDQGAPDKKLQHQIDWLDEQRKITPQMREMAHEIRLSGNDGAHPGKDGLQDVGKDQAEAVLAFLREFLQYLYQAPARLKRARSKAVEAPSSPASHPQGEGDRYPPQAGP